MIIEYWQQRSETGVNVTIYCSYRPRSDSTQLADRTARTGLKETICLSLFAQHKIQYTSATSDISWTARSQSDIYNCPRPKL